MLAPRGSVTHDESEKFESLLEDHRNRTNGRLVLELSQVPALDSRAVEALWDFADRQRSAGQTAKLAAVTELCREILELTGVAPHLDMYDSSESAVRSFI